MESKVRHQIELTAMAHVNLIHQAIVQKGTVDVIVEHYDRFIASNDAQRLGIERASVGQDTRSRLAFEVVCFTTYLSRAFAAKFFTERRWFRKHLNVDSWAAYCKALSAALDGLCEREHFHRLKDVAIVSVQPELTFGLGEALCASRRYSEYEAGRPLEQGGELGYFCQNIGAALDPKLSPFLEPLYFGIGTPLSEMAAITTEFVFLHGAGPSGGADA